MYQIITCQELKSRMDAGDELRICMIAPQWQWEAKHIPESICVSDCASAMKDFDPEDHIVVYCSSVDCSTSRQAAMMLDSAGFQHVWHFEEGLKAWEEAGLPFEGTEAT